MTEMQLNRDATAGTPKDRGADSTVDLGALFEAHAPAMYRTILAYTGGRANVAEDSVGEAFARAAVHSAELRDPVSWLYRVAFNVANDELRRERRARGTARESVQQPPELSGVLEALKRISPRERAVMALFYVMDLSVTDIAVRLGVASATVRVHLMRGRRHLAALLREEEVSD